MNRHYAIPVIALGTILMMMFTSVIMLFLVVHRHRQKKNIAERKEAEYRSQNEILRIRLEVEERAVNLLSQEIHDNVNQVLGIVRMQLLNAMRMDNKANADIIIGESCSRLKYVVTQLRDMSHLLSSQAIARMGLVHTIKKELSYIKSTTMLACNLECAEEELPLDPEQELLIARIIQESLNNIIRHSKADNVTVCIELKEHCIVFSISDNGIGMDRDALQHRDGVGFANLMARIELLNGSLDVVSEKGAGTTIIFDVPVA